jgi:hypothetical protein
MTPWWERIAGAADEGRDVSTPTEAQRHSVYDDRATSTPATTTVNVGGFRVEIPVCCADPALCAREECWTPIGGLR